MNPAQGFQTRQSALKKLAEAQEDKKYAEKTLDLKTHQRDALARGVEALPGLREESAGTSLAAVVDSKVEALREEITEARNALEADKKR